MRPLVLAKALLARDQLEARRGLPADGLEALLVGRPLDEDLLRFCADHWDPFTLEVGDRLAPGVPVDPLSADPGIRARSRARIESALDAAESFGAAAMTVHLVAGAAILAADEPPLVQDRDAALAEAKKYYGSLGSRLVVENILPVDFIGGSRVAHGPVGRMMDDFGAVGLPVCLDTAHLGAALMAARESMVRGRAVSVATDEGVYAAVFGPAEAEAGSRHQGLDLSEAVVREALRLAPGQTAHVHVGNVQGFGPDCDGRQDGELDLDRVVGRLIELGPRFLIPELWEADYVAYERNAGLIERLQELVGRTAIG
ncbi:MAG: sugar phosphate isomerase/epimerase [Proteobacteria bacterium]|nr:sugar phosphate isomerase/epimerase [Pseudomonadota bacterium]